MGKMKIKTSPSRKAFLVFDSLLMILLALVCIYPFWYVLCYSFSDTTAASVNPPVILPSGFTLSNYKEILTLKGFFPALGMSVLRTVVGTGLSVFCCSFLAYLFTKDKMPARKILYRFVVFTMYISGGMIAIYCNEILWIVKQFLGIYFTYNDFSLQYDIDQNIHRTASSSIGRICCSGWSRIYNLLFQNYTSTLQTNHCNSCSLCCCRSVELMV